MDFLIVTDVFSKYFLVRKLANSSSAAVCAEIATIVTELGLPHIIRSDNGPCYNSKEFQQLLQCYNITHHTSSPHHPRSNGFVKRMFGVAKKLMDKAGREGKPWISGLYEYRVTPQSGSITSPLQLITQHTPREKDLPQLPSTLGAQEMYETHQELIRMQQNKLEKNYIELTPGMVVWVQHRQNTSWEPATVVSQCSSNSYWIMQENGTDQPRVYRRTRTMLKIRCTDVRQTRHNYSQSTESKKLSFKLYLLPMNLETMSSTILFRKYITGPCPPNTIGYCCHFSHFRIRRKGRNCRNCRCTCTYHCTYTCTCTCTGKSQGTVPHSRIQKANEKESWKASQFI